MQKPQWNRIKDFVQRKELSLAMGLHLGAIFLCGLIYILLPEDVHLRWGLSYIPIWDCSSVTDCTDDCCTEKQKEAGDTPL